MNLHNRKFALSVLLAVGVLAVLIPAVLLITGIRRFGDAERMLDRSLNVLKSYYERNPFPSEGNIRQVRSGATELDGWFRTLLARLQDRNPPPQERSSTGFMNRLNQVRNTLYLQAGGKGGAISESFNFGFERYAAEGKVPAWSNVPRLTRQLRMVEALARVLIEGKAREWIAVRREEFESAADPRARALGADPAVAAPAGPDGGDPLYRRERFTLELRARERALLHILDGLARSEMFIVVTAMHLQKDASDSGVAPSTQRVDQPDADPVAAGEARRRLSRDERVVCGPAMEAPMVVKLQVDVYAFAEE